MTQGLNRGADHSSDNLNDALRTLTSELARADTKASIVLATTSVGLGWFRRDTGPQPPGDDRTSGRCSRRNVPRDRHRGSVDHRPTSPHRNCDRRRLVSLGGSGTRDATRPHARGSASRAGFFPLPHSRDQVPPAPSRNPSHPGWSQPAVCRLIL